jgi:hypothetical protein
MRQKRCLSSTAAIANLCALAALAPDQVKADAGGVGFWLPGIFGSLAAAPTVPGWAYASIYLHLQANAGATQNFVTNSGARGSVVTGLSAAAPARMLLERDATTSVPHTQTCRYGFRACPEPVIAPRFARTRWGTPE